MTLTFDVHQLDSFLLVGSGVLLLAILAVRLSVGVGLPSLLLYLVLGVLLGEDVIGVRLDDAQLAQNLGIAALAVILIEGGLTTSWSDIRALIGPAGLPADIVRRLQAATEQTMRDPAVLKTLAPQGFVAQGSSTEAAARTLTEEISKSQALVKAAAVTPE